MATVRLQLRRGTEAQWVAANPTLAAGEIGIETDTNTFKFGDGSTAWNSLSYALSQTVDDYILLSTKGVANGVASLDSSGFIPSSQLPPLAKVTVSAVANQAARLALTAEAGDIAIQSDNGQSYVLSASPASTDANWKALVGSEAVVDTVETALVAGTGLDKTYNDEAGTITIDIDSTVATLTGTQTLTNKTLTSPVINTPTGITKSDVGLANVDNTADSAKPVSTAQASAIATAKSEAQGYADEQIGLVLGAAPAALNTLNELATALGNDANFSGTITSSLATKAPINAPTFTGSVTLPSTTTIGDVSNVELGYVNGVTSGIQVQLDAKAPLASPTLTGTVTLPESTSIGDVSNLEIGYLNGVTSSVQGQIDAKLASATAATTYAPLASPTLTGTVTLPASTSIGDVSNLEIGYLNGVTSSVQGQIDAKLASATAATTYATLVAPTFTGNVTLPESTSIGDVSNLEIGYLNGVTSGIQIQLDAKQAVVANVSDVEIGYLDGVTSAIQTQLNTKQPVVANVSDVEIGYLDGVTSSIQTQIDTKAPLASPTFTGTVTLPANTITQSMMSDDSVGTAEIIAASVTSSELAVDSVTESKIADGAVTSAKIANGTIVDADINASAAIATSKISGLDTALGLKAPLASPTFTGTVSGITKTMVGLGSVDNTADLAKPVSTAQATAIATAKSEAIADATAQVNAVIASAPAALNTLDELAAALGDDANFASTVTTNLAAKAPLASPTFTGTVTVAAAGVAFTDGTQTKAGVPSLTTIGTEISAAYNLSTGGLALRDQLIPVAGTQAITIPTNATTAFPIGTSIDFYQASGTGANFVAADGTVTILRTPGLKLRTTHSSATLTKVAVNTWLLAGDLTA
jgi:hypothetical protein